MEQRRKLKEKRNHVLFVCTILICQVPNQVKPNRAHYKRSVWLSDEKNFHKISELPPPCSILLALTEDQTTLTLVNHASQGNGALLKTPNQIKKPKN